MTIGTLCRTGCIAVCMFLYIPTPANGSMTIQLSYAEAWHDASIVIVRGRAERVAYKDQRAYQDFQVTEVLKPRRASLPSAVLISGSIYAPFASLDSGNYVVFLQKQDETFRLMRSIRLDSPDGQQTLRGLRLFLKIMSTKGLAKQQELCLRVWNKSLSDPETSALLGAMWETKTPKYSRLLRTIAKGNDLPLTRSGAITILSYIGNDAGVDDLIPMLSSDPDYYVRRQLLLLFGSYRVQKAVPAIDALLQRKEDVNIPAWELDALHEMAQEARDKITGKNASPYWKN